MIYNLHISSDIDLTFEAHSIAIAVLLHKLIRDDLSSSNSPILKENILQRLKELNRFLYSDIIKIFKNRSFRIEHLISISYCYGFRLTNFVSLIDNTSFHGEVSAKEVKFIKEFFNPNVYQKMGLSKLIDENITKESQWRFLSYLVPKGGIAWDLSESNKTRLKSEMYDLLFS